MIEEFTKGLITAQNNTLEKLIRDAFHRHFDFDIEHAYYDKLKHIIHYCGDKNEVQVFTYLGVPFLYVTDWEYDYHFDEGKVVCQMKMKWQFV